MNNLHPTMAAALAVVAPPRQATYIILLRGREMERVEWDARADVDTVRDYLIRTGYHPGIDVRRSCA